MTKVYLNKISTAVPPHDVHDTFVAYIPSILTNERDRKMFRQMAHRSQIDHRFSVLRPHPNATYLDMDDFYKPGTFPSTEKRMQLYKQHAFVLACAALERLDIDRNKDDITHLIVTTCTGFYAPGIDLQIMQHYGLKPSVERTLVGFMGCQAAINALKLARHIVNSNQKAKVLVVNLELCTLHLQETQDLEKMLSFLIFADGCAASLISTDPVGIELESFHSTVLPDTSAQITWHVGDFGFDMFLSRKVPATLAIGLKPCMPDILQGHTIKSIAHWAIHPGGRSILDAVKTGIDLPEEVLYFSREILRRFGNMSSATIMFVLREFLESNRPGVGCALAFGPGLTAESMIFEIV